MRRCHREKVDYATVIAALPQEDRDIIAAVAPQVAAAVSG
jgi:hypothetical protein